MFYRQLSTYNSPGCPHGEVLGQRHPLASDAVGAQHVNGKYSWTCFERARVRFRAMPAGNFDMGLRAMPYIEVASGHGEVISLNPARRFLEH